MNNRESKGRWPARSQVWRSEILALLLLRTATEVGAQEYSIDWFTIEGGGGASAGDVYSVSGTIGQADAGATLIGGRYSLTGGFWSVLAVVQTPGAPVLTILPSSTNTVVISWPAISGAGQLQQNSALSTTNWVDVTDPVAIVGTENHVVISMPSGNRFYRLIRR